MKGRRVNTRSENMRAILDLPRYEEQAAESLPYPLPFWIEKELMAGLSREDINERIAYSKERSTFYLREFSRLDICETEKEHFQKCCEYHTARVLVWETALEKLTGLIL